MYLRTKHRHPWLLVVFLTLAFAWSVRAEAAEGPLVMVFNFLNSSEASVSADLGYKLKSGQLRDPDSAEFADLGASLKRAIAGKLTDTLGHGTVALPDPASSVSEGYLSDDDDCQKLAKEAGAKFFLKGAINHIRFQGNALIPNYYEMVVSAKLVSVPSGEVTWRMSQNLFPHYFKTKKNVTPADVFEGRLIPHIADVMTARVLAAIQSEAAQSP